MFINLHDHHLDLTGYYIHLHWTQYLHGQTDLHTHTHFLSPSVSLKHGLINYTNQRATDGECLKEIRAM